MESVVVIADDHPLFRDALKHAIENLLPGCSCPTAGDLDSVCELLGTLDSADLVLLDLAMPGVSGFSGLISVRAEFPEVPVIVVSATEDPGTIKKCLDLGASGFIPKSSGSELITDGIRSVLAGEIYVPPYVDLDGEGDTETDQLIRKLQSLTPQQTRVLSMLGKGLLNKQIAYELGVSEATVKAHVSAILLKLDADSRTQAVIIMNKIGSSFAPDEPASV